MAEIFVAIGTSLVWIEIMEIIIDFQLQRHLFLDY